VQFKSITHVKQTIKKAEKKQRPMSNKGRNWFKKSVTFAFWCRQHSFKNKDLTACNLTVF